MLRNGISLLSASGYGSQSQRLCLKIVRDVHYGALKKKRKKEKPVQKDIEEDLNKWTETPCS